MIVVHIITRFIRGGADENTLFSCNSQVEQGMTVHLIVGREFNKKMIDQLSPRVKLHVVGTLVREISPINDLVSCIAIRKIIKLINPDIVHTHTSKAGIVGRVGALLAGSAKLVHGIHILPFLNVGNAQKFIFVLLERILGKFTDKFVSVSDGMMAQAIAHKLGVKEKHVVIPSGMDVLRYSKADAYTVLEIRKLISNNSLITCESKILVMVAALEPRKRIAEFFLLFADLLKNHPALQLFILGEGRDEGRLLSIIENENIGANVHLLGFRLDVERWIASADICVLASEREGLPRVVIQYALQGKPVVATMLPGMEVAVRHGESGYLAEGHDVWDMKKYIEELLENPGKRTAMSREAGAIDFSAWSLENMALALSRTYEEVIKLN